MKLKTMESRRIGLGNQQLQSTLLGLVCALGLAATSAHAANTKPQPLKVGVTAKVTLEAGKSKDYSVALGKGSYRLVWDARRADGESSNLIGKIRLLKPNGAVIDSSVLTFNEIAVAYRVGTIFKSAKPFVARFRLENDGSYENWFTVVPVSNAKRIPFGWGEKITPARIASDNGVGGELEPKESIYHSITLPKGKWSISLGLTLPDGERSNLIGSVDLLDTLGFTQKSRLVGLNEIADQARQEGIVNVLKPTPYLLRVTNGTDSKNYTYDVTIEPAS